MILKDQRNDNSNKKPSIENHSTGWSRFGLRFLGAFILYAAASHVFFPTPMTVNVYSPLKILVFYLVSYLMMFLSIYLVISVPIVIVAKIIPKYRRITMPKLLSYTLIPALIIGGLLIRGGWYASKMAGGP